MSELERIINKYLSKDETAITYSDFNQDEINKLFQNMGIYERPDILSMYDNKIDKDLKKEKEIELVNKRFPDTFCFQLTENEFYNLRSQFAISSENSHGGVRYLPYVLTEQGIMMLSGLLKSDIAVKVNVQITDDIQLKIKELRKYDKYCKDIKERLELIQKILIILIKICKKKKTILEHYDFYCLFCYNVSILIYFTNIV